MASNVVISTKPLGASDRIVEGRGEGGIVYVGIREYKMYMRRKSLETVCLYESGRLL